MQQTRWYTFSLAVLPTVLWLALGMQVSSTAAAEAQKFTLINVIFDGTKVWLPSSLIVPEGATVELTLINKLEEPHGFKIAEFGVETVVQPKAQTNVTFTAAKAGVHNFVCHMHPPHIGGQLLVTKK
jgi:heme/copper-type cytochrome/quinol oxidase subunit 2